MISMNKSVATPLIKALFKKFCIQYRGCYILLCKKQAEARIASVRVNVTYQGSFRTC